MGGRPDLDDIVTALSSGEVPVVPYTHLDMADDLIAVADDMGSSRVHLVGASSGGMVVRWAAIRHPRRVVTLTVVMSGSGAMPGDHRSRRDHIPYLVGLWRDQWGTTFAFDEVWATERLAETFERSALASLH